MNNLKKSIFRNAEKLQNSNKTLCDIYSIIMSHNDSVFLECATMTRKVTYTYADVSDRIDSVAASILQRFPNGNAFIGLHGENSPEWIISFWAILKSGNKPYVINLRQPKSSTEEILNTLGANAVITVNSNIEYGIQTVSYKDLSCIDIENEYSFPEFSNEFAISTSGTTLKQKVCIYSGQEISEQILNLESIIDTNKRIVAASKDGIKMLAFLPLYHVFGLVAMFLWYAFFGSTFVFLNDYAPENILRTIRNHGVTHVFAVPMLWHAIEKAVRKEIAANDEKMRSKFEKACKTSLKLQNFSCSMGTFFAKLAFKDVRSRLLGNEIRFCISGGSYIKTSAVELLNAIGYPLCNGYGMTEIGICSVELGKSPKERILCSIGKPFDSLEYKIEKEGRLFVKGSSLCRKCIIDGKEVYNNDWFDTGDIVSVDDDGRYYINGRFSDVVFSDDGENLNPDLAEKAFSLRDAIDFSVLGNEDNTKLVLIVRISRNLLVKQKERLKSEIELCNSSLPASYRVKDVKFTFDSLVEDGGIKVSRAYLRKAIRDKKIRLFDSNEPLVEISNSDNELKRIIRETFATVLDRSIDTIGDDMHFMNDLGGTSLDYFTLINELDKRFDLKIDFGSEYNLEQFGYTVNHFEKLIKDLIN